MTSLEGISATKPAGAHKVGFTRISTSPALEPLEAPIFRQGTRPSKVKPGSAEISPGRHGTFCTESTCNFEGTVRICPPWPDLELKYGQRTNRRLISRVKRKIKTSLQQRIGSA